MGPDGAKLGYLGGVGFGLEDLGLFVKSIGKISAQ